MVVGANNSPEIRPLNQDWGLEKTVLYGEMMLLRALPGWGSLVSRGMISSRPRPIPAQMMAQAIQKLHTLTPWWIIGPTTNWPADPPSMPMHCVMPIAVAIVRAEKPCEAR